MYEFRLVKQRIQVLLAMLIVAVFSAGIVSIQASPVRASTNSILASACNISSFNIAGRDMGTAIEWGMAFTCYGLAQNTVMTVRTYENNIGRDTYAWTQPAGNTSGTKSRYVNLANRNQSVPARVKVVLHYDNGLQSDTVSIEQDVWYDPW